MWESLWSCVAGQLIRGSTETSRVTAVSDVLTELVYFHLKSNTSCLHLPSAHSWIFIHLSLTLSLSLSVCDVCPPLFHHTVVQSLQMTVGICLTTWWRPCCWGTCKHSETLAHTQWLQHCREWGGSIFFLFFFCLPLHAPPFFLRITSRLWKHKPTHVSIYM